MDQKTVFAPEGAFRTRLLPGAMVLALLAVVCGIPPLFALLSPEYRELLVRKLVTSGIASRSAVTTWSIINGVISLMCVICPSLLAAGLGTARRGDPVRGFGLLSAAGSWGVRIVDGTGLVLAALYVVRALLYVIGALGHPQGMMMIYSMILMEGLMGVLAWGVYRCARSFAEGFGDAMASMAYTLSSGRIDNASIPAAAERGFLALGIVCPLWAVSQTVTMTAVITRLHSYYTVVFASHPMEWLTAASLVLNGGASVLMYLYLRRYNRICEWEKYQAGKKQ